MRLVFVHGWAFDTGVWRNLLPLLADFTCVRIDLGFLGAPRSLPALQPDDVLIGHSLGFMWGIHHYAGWRRWVAINGFARFNGMCAPEKVLSAMQRNLKRDARETVAQFYDKIGYTTAPSTLNENALSEGLDWLKRMDVSDILSQQTGHGLVLASRNDPIVPDSASAHLATCCADARLNWRMAGSHLLPLLDPMGCAASIREFLA